MASMKTAQASLRELGQCGVRSVDCYIVKRFCVTSGVHNRKK